MTPATLLSDLKARGVEFEAHGDKLRFRPVDLVAADELDVIRKHKAALLALLKPNPAFDVDNAPEAEPTPVADPAITVEPVCRCGSTTCRDVPIHDGQSLRRDCGRCGRFIDFPIWYGNDTGHNDQHTIS